MALGYTVALGACMALGTIGEKIFMGEFLAMFDNSAGRVKLLALAVAIAGTVVTTRTATSAKAETREIRRLIRDCFTSRSGTQV